MSKRITWTTPKGSAVALELRTTKIVNADGDKVEVPDWALVCELPTTILITPVVAEHPTAGTCLKGDRNMWVPITVEVLSDVRALVETYETELARRIKANDEAEREYQIHHNRIRRAMAE